MLSYHHNYPTVPYIQKDITGITYGFCNILME